MLSGSICAIPSLGRDSTCLLSVDRFKTVGATSVQQNHLEGLPQETADSSRIGLPQLDPRPRVFLRENLELLPSACDL